MSQESRPNESKNAGLPDLYRILGFSAIESDVAKLERTIRVLETKGAGLEPKQAERVARIVAIARKNLLEPARKQAYDLAWAKQFATNGEISTQVSNQRTQVEKPVLPPPESGDLSASPEWDMSELEMCLPVEDPHAPFDMAHYLKTTPVRDFEATAAADFEKLNRLLGGTAVLEVPGKSVQTEAIRLTPPDASVPDWLPDEPRLSMAVKKPAAGQSSAKMPARSAAATIKQIRKKRVQSMVLAITGMLMAICVVFGVMYALVSRGKNQEQLAQADTKKDNVIQPTNDEAVAPADSVSKNPESGGLPKVPGQGVVEPMFTEPESDKPPNGSEAGNMNEPAKPEMMDMNKTEPPKPQETTKPVEEPPKPAPMPVLTDAEKSDWTQLALSVRKILARQEFDEARSTLDQLAKVVKVPAQREQLARLKLVAELSEEFHSHLSKAVEGLSAGETIRVGSTQLSFVEGDANSITIKQTGRVQKYPFTELPNGIAYGIANLQMDVEHPRSAACRAAFAWAHPKTNALTLKEARSAMGSAVAANAVPADTPKIFDDDFSLP